VSTLNRVDDANVGKVVDQSPGPNTQVDPKSSVVLTIGIASTSPSTGTTSTTGPTTGTT
jgi:beta-lactam-binding protein with PASTA domain